jgi:hypothetical protein
MNPITEDTIRQLIDLAGPDDKFKIVTRQELEDITGPGHFESMGTSGQWHLSKNSDLQDHLDKLPQRLGLQLEVTVFSAGIRLRASKDGYYLYPGTCY